MSHSVRFLRAAATGVLLTVCLTVSASALTYGVGTVTGDSLRLRESASTDSAILTTAAKGTDVVVLEDQVDGWYKVALAGTEGYMFADYLSVSVQADTDLGTGTLDTDGSTLNLRAGPGTEYSKLASIPASATLTLTGISNGWYKTSYNGVEGYVSSDYVVLSKTAGVAAANTDLGSQVVAYAKQFLGLPYVYGASGPNSFDCSGFTSYVYKHFGYTLNRSAAGQYSNGTSIDQSQLQPGDLLLWRAYGSSKTATHVGIYIGDNQYIHASSTGGCIRINDMNYAANSRYLVGVRRILA
ncbi:MAG: C40 family peptidase [Oscillospiraceae bacterium]